MACRASGNKNPNWRGGRFEDVNGYVRIRMVDHQRANKEGYVYEHIAIAERAIGKPLPVQAQVHHVNFIPNDNRNSNLVICENDGYHKLLHRRTEAYLATGNPEYRKCKHCKKFDSPSALFIPASGDTPYHNACANQRNRKRYAAKHQGGQRG